jgi:hypothetical protein
MIERICGKTGCACDNGSPYDGDSASPRGAMMDALPGISLEFAPIPESVHGIPRLRRKEGGQRNWPK